MNTLWC